jgi:restriction endonuclease S subunit
LQQELEISYFMYHSVFLLQELGSITQGLSVSRYRNSNGILESIVNVKDLENLYIDHEVDKIELNGTASIQQHRLEKNDVIIAIRGSLLKSSVVTQASAGSFAGQNVAVFRPISLERVNPGYIAVLLRSKWMEQSLNVLYRRSSTNLPSIRVSDLREIKIPLPVISIQNQINQLFILLESYEEITLNALEARKELTETAILKLFEEI